jgi:predicted nuclease of predicted toxin-antitoxin system
MEFDLEASAVRDLGLRDAKDREIFDAARKDGVVVMTKDRDFVELVSASDRLRRFCGSR